ncbi:NAD(P)H-binding protein [Gorillibacterium sp. sgz500922]|uniref:NAD(P)H-binding protein n=1 Tax=Gorillibacterium sp. sgz500922 TaxID=3446694 RepID=UPI003F66E3C6
MTLILTGASGKLGRLIIRNLLAADPSADIVACVRCPEAAADLAEQGVTVRRCDYDQPETLVPAFKEADKLLAISSPHPDDTVRMRQHAHLVEAAKRAEAKHLLYTGFAFAEKGTVPLCHLHLATEQAIRASGIPFTFLRSALYTDVAESFGLRQALTSGAVVTASGAWRFNTVTRSDLAAAIAAVLLGTGFENRSFNLTAARSWTFPDLAAALEAVYGRPVQHRVDPQTQHWIYGFLSRIDSSSTSADLQCLLGRPPITLTESIRSLLEQDLSA